MERPQQLSGVNLRFAPTSELGVVYLFAELAKRWRVRVDHIGAAFPDCIGYQTVRGREKKIRIEFEYRSRNFRQHGHDPRKCDWIVCWEHDWPDAPAHLEIRELRREFGLGFNVWILPFDQEWETGLGRMKPREWTVPSQAHKGDLALVYINRPESAIKFVYRLKERAALRTAGWKRGKDYRALLEPVCKLASPIFLDDLREHRIIRTASFVRGQMQGKPNAMDYWPHLFRLITSRNRPVRRALAPYAPERLR